MLDLPHCMYFLAACTAVRHVCTCTSSLQVAAAQAAAEADKVRQAGERLARAILNGDATSLGKHLPSTVAQEQAKHRAAEAASAGAAAAVERPYDQVHLR